MSTQPTKGALHVWLAGPKGRILTYTRPNSRCLSRDFLVATPKHLAKRFDRLFARFADDGMRTAANGSFKPMTAEGKGLWVFKEHDHRLLCFRGPDLQIRLPNGNTRPCNQIVLLDGWVKDKDFTVEERVQLQRIQGLRVECERTTSWDDVVAARPPQDAVEKLKTVLDEPLLSPRYREALEGIAADYGIHLETDTPDPTEAAKGPATPPPTKPTQSTPLTEEVPTMEQTTDQTTEQTAKRTTVSMQELAGLANVPYKWLWLMIKRGYVPGYSMVHTDNGNRETKVWPWEGIDKVVTLVENLRKEGIQGAPRAKPVSETPSGTPATTPQAAPPVTIQPELTIQPEPLLTMARVARAVGTSKGTLRRAVIDGHVQPVAVRDGIRLFRVSEVREWYENRSAERLQDKPPTEGFGPTPSVTPAVSSYHLVPALIGPVTSNGKPQSKAALRSWLDDLLIGKRTDTEDFVAAIRHHLEYRQKLERELQALAEG